MLTVNNFCVALCKLSSVQPSVQPAHVAIGLNNNNAGQCVGAEQNLLLVGLGVFFCTHSRVETIPDSLQKPELKVEVGAHAPDTASQNLSCQMNHRGIFCFTKE